LSTVAVADARLPGQRERWGKRILVFVMLRFDLEDQGEVFRVKPCGREDVCAALAFEEEGQPQWEGGAAGR
jgi:hypothetical protein